MPIMQRLKSQIETELKTANHCAVYDPELKRVWGRPNKARIAEFAKKNGWRLRSYHDGLCAIFDKQAGR